MIKTKIHSVNCQACGNEIHSFQGRDIAVGSILMNLCTKCQANSSAWENFKIAAIELNKLYKLGQLDDAQLKSPNIEIQPAEGTIQKAVKLLQRMDPNYFVGVRKIEVGAESNYGHVSSGDNQDPTVVHINLQRIINEADGKADGREAIINAAVAIAHESGHVKSYDDKNGFVGNESPAQAEEQKVTNWIKANENRLQDLFN